MPSSKACSVQPGSGDPEIVGGERVLGCVQAKCCVGSHFILYLQTQREDCQCVCVSVCSFHKYLPSPSWHCTNITVTAERLGKWLTSGSRIQNPGFLSSSLGQTFTVAQIGKKNTGCQLLTGDPDGRDGCPAVLLSACIDFPQAGRRHDSGVRVAVAG